MTRQEFMRLSTDYAFSVKKMSQNDPILALSGYEGLRIATQH